jgi:hypothetical protein
VLDPVSDDEVVVRSKALFPVSEDGVFEGLYRDVVVRTAAGWRIRHKSMTSFGGAASPWLAGIRLGMEERGAALR